MEEALRSIGPDPVAEFSRELVRIVGFNVGQKAVSVVQRTLYLRQFLHCLPRHLIPYVEGLLDCELDVELLAARRNEHLEKVSLLCAEAWAALPRAIESEYDDQDLATRTDGFWSIAKLKEL